MVDRGPRFFFSRVLQPTQWPAPEGLGVGPAPLDLRVVPRRVPQNIELSAKRDARRHSHTHTLWATLQIFIAADDPTCCLAYCNTWVTLDGPLFECNCAIYFSMQPWSKCSRVLGGRKRQKSLQGQYCQGNFDLLISIIEILYYSRSRARKTIAAFYSNRILSGAVCGYGGYYFLTRFYLVLPCVFIYARFIIGT